LSRQPCGNGTFGALNKRLPERRDLFGGSSTGEITLLMTGALNLPAERKIILGMQERH